MGKCIIGRWYNALLRVGNRNEKTHADRKSIFDGMLGSGSVGYGDEEIDCVWIVANLVLTNM